MENKKVLNTEDYKMYFNNLIISNKTYSVKELACIFDYNVLMLIDDKNELMKYYQMAVETGIKRFRDIVDSVYERKFRI